MKLPESFENRMKDMLGDECETFLAGYDQERVYGLRVNTAKISPEEFEKLAPFSLKKIPWIENGFFYDPKDQPTKHPYYFAGLYYMQEPSAMTPASRLPAEPGDCVLDLCAAPGGKATELGTRLRGQGLLVANDISAPRMKALLKNVEVAGIPNAFLTNEKPERLAEAFPSFFDKILVDAPCSGEGMFRKEPAVMEAWTTDKPDLCAAMQTQILDAAVQMLKPGGYLLYSTCTFAPQENERQIARILQEYPEFSAKKITPWYEGFRNGCPDWADGNPELAKTVRIWPQYMDGEGHYLALLKKAGERTASVPLEETKKSLEKMQEKALQEFFRHVHVRNTDYTLDIRNGMVYAVPQVLPKVRGIKFVRNGLLLGELKKDRFEPSQPLAMALKKEEYEAVIDLPAEDDRVKRYLKGETIRIDEAEAAQKKGWQLLCVDGYPLGWGKLVNGILKNKFLSGWRMH